MSTYTRDQVKELGYLIIDKKVYDAQAYGLTDHPGGKVILSQLGRDATDPFRVFHPDSAYEVLANFYVGDLQHSDLPDADPFTLDVRRLNEEFKQQGLYKTSILFNATIQLIALSLLGLTIAGLTYYGHTIGGVLASAASLALFFQQSGWLGHDYCHNQVSENRVISRVGALIWGPCAQGLSSQWWKNKHNQHHSTPNVHGADPDMDSHPFFAWSDHALDMFSDVPDGDLTNMFAKVLVTHQLLCYFPLLTFARLSWSIKSLMADFHEDSKAPYAERFALLFHWTWVIALVQLIPSYSLRALFLFTAIGLNGQFIAMVFAINHNGMQVLSKDEWDTTELGFFELQVRTGRDIESSILGEWFSGGLNQQVTHHLFPKMPRHRYAQVQPTIEELCRQHGVPYHQTSFLGGTGEVLNRLNDVANAARKITHKSKAL